MRTPIVFIIFNRPDLTERVFREIARARPPKLLVIADGPRPGCADDTQKCAATRAIIERVDWPCDVLKNYSDANMGCGHRPASGLRWAFDEVEEAIILEDDCVPHPTFFPFCEELLERYRDDERVMHISGNQFVARPKQPIFSYSVSRYCLSWGWATWRRAFRHYDPEIRLWPALSGTSWLPDVLGDERAAAHWKRVFDRAHVERDRAGYWDFQWIFACWAQQGVSLLPEANLISNIGFGEDATHTKRANDKRAHLPSVPMTFPLRHPPFLVRDPDQDRMIFEKVVISQSKRSLFGRVRRRCASALPEPLRRAISLMKSKFFQTHGQPS